MAFPIVRSRLAARRVAGVAWFAGWCAVLWAVAAPWRNLGGLESERLRWLEWWALCSGIALGFTLGRGARDWARSGVGRTHARALRLALYPPGIVAALALVALSIWGERGPIGVVATAFLSYWAGLDVAFGAVPLMEGRSYSLTRPLDPYDENEDEDEIDDDDREAPEMTRSREREAGCILYRSRQSGSNHQRSSGDTI